MERVISSAPLFAGSLFLGMLLFLEVGRRCGVRCLAKYPEEERVAIGMVEGAVYGLLSLLLAFTFNGAASRFDARRQLIVEETNAIGTAYLRLDLLPTDTQPALRENFRQYVETRLAAYRKLPDVAAAKAELARSIKLQGAIWTQAIDAARRTESPAVITLVLSSLNEMIDITTTRTVAVQTHPPVEIFAMLFGVALASALLAGYGMAANKARNWVFGVGFAAVVAVAVFVTIDLEFPRVGLIRIDSVDQILVELRESMNPR
ncbi:MAG: DUF4239 domain-containing protein [Deltaproteobacteria bacterium]|nr:DUF4239 domain-containing protein [Deltaproteobacteria bacterium]